MLERDSMQDERDLWIASRRYLLGKISFAELKAVEEKFNDAFDRGFHVLAKRSLRRKLWGWIRCH